MAETNYQKLLRTIQQEKRPFIICDIETTGLMNGNDNKITEIALTKYNYNVYNNKYELQDNLFMLSKANPDILKSIEEKQQPTEQNAIDRLKHNYVYGLQSTAKRKVDLSKKYIKEYQEKIQNKEKNPSSVKYSLETLKQKLNKYQLALKDATKQYDKVKDLTVESLSISNSEEALKFKEYLQEHLSEEIEKMKKEPSLNEILLHQGINKDTWIKEKQGLNSGELQIGINEFLKKYQTNNTVMIYNGKHYASHYLEKENIQMGDNESIDLIQAERSRGIQPENNRWTSNIGDFANMYKSETGKEIKTFDAFTKALCYGQIVSKAANVELSNRSIEQLSNAVTQKTFEKDSDYIMSLSRASSLCWIPAKKEIFTNADYHFNSLEYINFGNDKRYVDIDKMFEINNNFEITLEGEKEPIKTWKELETKIKALNSEISDELLNKIKDKYEELEIEAMKEKNNSELNKLAAKEKDISAKTEEELLQSRLSDIIKDFDKKYELSDSQEKILATQIERETELAKDFMKKNIETLIPFIQEVNARTDNYFNKSNSDYNKDIVFEKTVKYLSYGNHSSITLKYDIAKHNLYISDLTAGLKDWNYIKEAIISDGQVALLNELNEKNDFVQNQKSKLNKLKHRPNSYERD